jgi:hypothetical protein
VKFANPVRGVIQAKPEKWDGKGFKVTATFRDHIIGKRPPGLDLGDGRQGDAVLASDDGAIVAAFKDAGNGALVVRQRAASQVGTIIGYAHLIRYTVSVGQRVKRGDVIGYVGMTGADAPHLHFGVTVNGREVDPEPYLTIGTTPPEEDMKPIPRGVFGHIVNRKTTLAKIAGFYADPDVTSELFEKYPVGTPFIPTASALVAGSTWRGGFLFDDEEGGYVFGWFQPGSLNPLVANEEVGYGQGFNDGLAAAEDAVEKVPEK